MKNPTRRALRRMGQFMGPPATMEAEPYEGDIVRDALNSAADIISQFMTYSDEMSQMGRGLSLTGPNGEPPEGVLQDIRMALQSLDGGGGQEMLEETPDVDLDF